MKLLASADASAVAARIRDLPSSAIPAVLAILTIPAAYAFVKNIADTGTTNIQPTPEVLDAVNRAIDYVEHQEWIRSTAADMAETMSFSRSSRPYDAWLGSLTELGRKAQRYSRFPPDPKDREPDWTAIVTTFLKQTARALRPALTKLRYFDREVRPYLSDEAKEALDCLTTRVSGIIAELDAGVAGTPPYRRNAVTALQNALHWMMDTAREAVQLLPVQPGPGNDDILIRWIHNDLAVLLNARAQYILNNLDRMAKFGDMYF